MKRLNCLLGRHSIRDEDVKVETEKISQGRFNFTARVKVTAKCLYCQKMKSYEAVIPVSIKLEDGRNKDESAGTIRRDEIDQQSIRETRA